MNKELEKAIHRIEIHKDYARLTNGTCIVNKQDLETVLKELKRLQEDYIAKDKIREKIEECIKNIEEDEKDEWGYETYVVQVLNKLLNAN